MTREPLKQFKVGFSLGTVFSGDGNLKDLKTPAPGLDQTQRKTHMAAAADNRYFFHESFHDLFNRDKLFHKMGFIRSIFV